MSAAAAAPEPVIDIVALSPSGTAVVVSCPFCGGRHLHGWPAGDANVGRRVPHCGRGSYVVQGTR